MRAILSILLLSTILYQPNAQQNIECPFIAAVVSCPNPLGSGTSTAIRLKWTSSTFPGCVPDTIFPDTIGIIYSADGGLTVNVEKVTKIPSSCEGAPKYAINYHAPTFGGCQCTLYDGLVVINNNICAYIDGILPIQLGAINVSNINKKPVLQWTTVTEKNSAYFTIQRSFDGITFNNIYNFPASGDSKTEKYYSYTDQETDKFQNHTTIYYRLIMIDKDDNFSYSPTVSLNIDREGQGLKIIKIRDWNISSNVNIYYNADISETIIINLIDLEGKLIKSVEEFSTVGLNNCSMLLPDISSGNYYLTITNGRNIDTQKLIYSNF